MVSFLKYVFKLKSRLDASLYRDCKKDAEEICSANDFDADTESRLPDNFVIACLYRNALHVDIDPNEKLQKVMFFNFRLHVQGNVSPGLFCSFFVFISDAQVNVKIRRKQITKCGSSGVG